jgi:hypothetical protein
VRLLFGFTHVVFGLALTLRSCGNGDAGKAPRPDLALAPAVALAQSAPDIVGEDTAGIPFRLSDHQGKVVVLTFWADF